MIAARGLPRLTPKTITEPEALKRELAKVRAMGYAVSAEENEVGGRWARRSSVTPAAL